MLTLTSIKYGLTCAIIGIVTISPAVRFAPWVLGLSVVMVALLAAATMLERDGTLFGQSTPDDMAAVEAIGRVERSVLIVGAGSLGRSLAETLEKTESVRVAGFVDDNPTSKQAGKWPILGSRADTAQLVAALRIDEVIVVYAPAWHHQLVQELNAEGSLAKVRVVPTAYDAGIRMDDFVTVGEVPVIDISVARSRGYDFVKRTVDFTFALSALLLLSPIILVVAIVIRLSSRGPIIFTQERVGRNGKVFTLFKFRTMRPDAEVSTGPVLSVGKLDSRLTPAGRFLRACRMDEVPQFVNVLLGEMSLVGPRPERPHFVAMFERSIPGYGRRHDVWPGITGLAQVCAGYHTDARDKLRYDLIYASHRSLMMDLSIVLRTIAIVIMPRHQ